MHTLIRPGSSAIITAILVTLGGCGTSPPQPPGAQVYPAAEVASRLSPEQAGDLTLYAISLVGTPYRYGGNTPDSGFDCSGLIGYVYQSRVGLAAPRTVSKLQSWGAPVAEESIRSGDLVLFAQRNQATHAGIYVGEGRFVHAPSTGGEVRLDSLNSNYWARQRVSFRRP
jgi:cell wall-associated NlpC family hydrolase